MNLSNITTITSSTALTSANNTYIVNAGSTGGTGATGPAIDITLPLISIDGMNYKLVRDDRSSRTVTVSGTGGNLIIQNLGVTGDIASGSTGPFNLLTLTTAEFQSFRNNWYITNRSLNKIVGRAIFSTAFVANNGRLYFTADGSVGPTGTITPVCLFTYPGTNAETAVALESVVQNGAAPAFNAVIRLRNAVDDTIVYGTGAYTPLPGIGGLSIATISSFNNLPMLPTIVLFDVAVVGASSSRLRLYSMSLR